MQLSEPSKQSVEKFYQYPILCSMEVDFQEKIKELHFLLDLWNVNAKSQVLSKNRAGKGNKNLFEL